MSKRITVFAWRDLWHPDMGGAEIYLTKMLEGLVSKGNSVTVLTARYPGSKAREKRDGITYIRMGNAVSIFFVLPLYYIFKVKRQTDLLIESYNAMPFWVPIFEKKYMVIVYHIQSVEWIRNLGRILGGGVYSLLTFFFPIVYRCSDIITISPSTQDEIERLHVRPSSIDIVSTGIDMPVVGSIEKPSGVVNIISLGRLKMTKNVDKSIRLIEFAVKTMGITNVRMKVAGKGEEENRLREMVNRLGLGKYVEFVGYVSDEEKIELYRWGHIHLQLSEKEGWGITAIEAASQATPTLCFDVPGLRDSVKDTTGYIAKSEEDLYALWRTLLSDIQNRSLGYTNRQKACLDWARKYEWASQTEKFDQVVERHLVGS